MDRRRFMQYSAAALAAGGLGAPMWPRNARGAQTGALPGGDKPNIVLIFVDDLGYGELGCQGNTDIPTPRIDELAAGGVRFTQGYVTAPVCSPSRAGLLTGRYQQRFGHEFNPGKADRESGQFGLPLDQVTFADHLKALGYATGVVGKWHLGNEEEYFPTRRGFDEFFGFLSGANDYFHKKKRRKGKPIMRGEDEVIEKEYLTDAFAREAESFIDRHAGSPFLLYLSLNAVHKPLQADQARLDKFAHIQNEKRRKFAAMTDAMDQCTGRVLDRLRALGLEDNTLVAFISDNGGPTTKTTSGNGPLNGFKGQVLEGGIRIPFMMKWPGVLPSGDVYETPVSTLDMLPTMLDAAGRGEPPGIDGVSLLPFLTGERKGAPHPNLFWRIGAQHAVRAGDWKLVQLKKGGPKLFDLFTDVGETNDLAASRPDKLKELKALFDDWNASNVDALWWPNTKKRKNNGW